MIRRCRIKHLGMPARKLGLSGRYRKSRLGRFASFSIAKRGSGTERCSISPSTASYAAVTATSAVGAARERASGLAGQAGSVAGAANGAAAGAGALDSGMLAVAGSGAADGEGAFAVAPGMPVNLPIGEQLGNVRDIVATRRGEIRELVVDTVNGPTAIPAANLTGNALITGEGSGSASSGNEASPETWNEEVTA